AREDETARRLTTISGIGRSPRRRLPPRLPLPRPPQTVAISLPGRANSVAALDRRQAEARRDVEDGRANAAPLLDRRRHALYAKPQLSSISPHNRLPFQGVELPIIATAAWSIPRTVADAFPREGSGLARYAAVFNGVE